MIKICISVTSHALDPPLSQAVTPSRTPSPSSVTYFMDGTLENLSMRALSLSIVRLHQAEEAHRSRAIVVARATEWRPADWRPWALSTLRAYIDCEQDAIKLSTSLVACKSAVIVTPRIFMDFTP